MGKYNITDIKVVFDTGSDWLVIPGTNCSNCEGNRYNGANQSIPTVGHPSHRQYGTASLFGQEYTDKVCLGEGADHSCVEEFEYFLIED